MSASITAENLPKTLAIIPDGNRRWAKSHKFSTFNGYKIGVKKFISFSDWCLEYGINNLTVWALSTENIRRSSKERNTLFSIYLKFANDKAILEKLHKNRTHLRIIGNLNLLPKDLARSLKKVDNETKIYKDRVINMLIGYGGKSDILHAVKDAVRHVKNAAAVSDALLQKYLISKTVPAIDLVIRTSGERRLSGFMPWQTEYSELYFSKKLWPDFEKRDLHSALLDYSRRQRRFGK